MSAPTVASLAREVAGLIERVEALAARLDRQDRIDGIMSSAHLPAPPPRRPERDRHGLRAVEGTGRPARRERR